MGTNIATYQAVKRILVQIEISRAYGRSLLAGIAEYSRQNGPWAFYHNDPFYSKEAFMSPEKIIDWNPDGVITRSESHVELLRKCGIPTVIAIHLDNVYAGMPHLKGDNEAMGQMAAEYLIKLGFQRFAYCGLGQTFWSQDRGRSFEQIVNSAGFPSIVFESDDEPESSEADQLKMVEWLESLPKPIGIMVCNDDMGKQLIEACKIAGVRVPDDVAIIGVDNDEVVCSLCNPSLSSIKLDNIQAGYRIASVLDDMMDGKEPNVEEILVKPISVVVRQSTDIYCVGDEDISRALKYIIDNSKEMIQVSDVAEHVCLSRRALQLRFKNALGYSVHERIKKEKINRMAELLTETDMSIIEIALSLGFSNINHVSRFFKQEKGLSPNTYRKKYMMQKK